MAVTTKYEARFFCVTSPYTVWFLGRLGGSIKVAGSVLRQCQPAAFFDDLVDHCLGAAKLSPSIPLVINSSTKFLVGFDTAEDNLLLIDLWIGSEVPRFEVIKSKPHTFIASEHAKGLKDGYQYMLISGSHMCANQPTLFLTMINYYLKHCTDTELEELTDKGKQLYLRFRFIFDDEQLPPGAIVCQRDITKCTQQYQQDLSKCPDGYIPCELLREVLGYFIFVKRDKVLKRDKIIEADIKLGD